MPPSRPWLAFVAVASFLLSPSSALLPPPSSRLRVALALGGHAVTTMAAEQQCTTTLYDLPVSNNGARVRAVIYYKGLEEQVNIVSPMELGGLKSAEFLALNPQGKMPTLTTSDGPIAESDVIVRYLLDR